jgi:hypothetical protein
MANQTLTTPTAVTVLGTATLVLAASRHPERSVLIQSLSTNTLTVYIGGSDVTTANGIELLVGKSMSLDVTGAIYAIRGASNQELRVLVDHPN